MIQNSFSKALLCTAISAAFAAPLQALQLEEVTVTARKKTESIQDVPVAVTAITGSDIEQAFTLDVTGLQAFSPNVVFDTIEMGTPGGGGFSIRGISYQDVDKGFDPTVLVSVDDVPLATGTGQVFDMIDIERIEVLRGPQGTLFGKNVVGGLINIHRVKPQLDETSGKLRFRYGEYDKSQGDFLYNYGEEDWAIKVTGGVSRQGEGYIDNIAGGDLWYRDSERFGAHILWQPNDTLTAEFMYDYSSLSGDPGTVFNTSAGVSDGVFGGDIMCVALGLTCSPGAGVPSTGSRDVGAINGPQWNELDKHQATVRITANVTDDHVLTYVGSVMKSDDDQAIDGDGHTDTVYHFRRWGDFDQITHEIRLSRDTGSNFTWQTGIFNAYAEGTNNQHTLVVAPPISQEFGRTTSNSYSVFAEGDLALLDEKLVLTAGARYINETKKLAREAYSDRDDPSSINLGPNAGGSISSSKVIYRLGARYHFNDDFMAYITRSTGFRSGGLSPRAIDPYYLSQGYEPELLTNHEMGLRTTMLDGSLQFNLTAFHMKYDDMQIELAIAADRPPGNQNFVVNAGSATIKGLELDFTWLISDWWRLQGNVGTLDTEYDELFVNLYGFSPLGSEYNERDESGLKLRRAPDLSWGLTSTMEWDAFGGNLTWRASYSWTDKYEATTTNYPESGVEETGILDSSLSLDLNEWQVSLYGRNLTDEDSWTHNYVVNAFREDIDGNGALWRFAQRRPPREIGMEVLYKF